MDLFIDHFHICFSMRAQAALDKLKACKGRTSDAFQNKIRKLMNSLTNVIVIKTCVLWRPTQNNWLPFVQPGIKNTFMPNGVKSWNDYIGVNDPV